MKLKIFSVYDSKAQAFLPPFFLPNEEMAKRTFADCVNSPSHQFGINPADYTLFALGEFDDNAGTMESYPPSSLGLAVEYVKKDKE